MKRSSVPRLVCVTLLGTADSKRNASPLYRYIILRALASPLLGGLPQRKLWGRRQPMTSSTGLPSPKLELQWAGISETGPIYRRRESLAAPSILR